MTNKLFSCKTCNNLRYSEDSNRYFCIFPTPYWQKYMTNSIENIYEPTSCICHSDRLEFRVDLEGVKE